MVRAGIVHGPARTARSGVHRPHGIVPPVMQTSLSRRQRRRRLNDKRRPRGSGAAKYVALAIPLLMFTTIALLGVAGATTVVAGYSFLAKDLPDPKKTLEAIEFDQQTAVWDRTGEVLLARLGSDRREVVTFDQIPPVLVDATTAIEDKTFWENSGFDPAGLRVRGRRHAAGQRPRRLHDHPAARSQPAPAQGVRGRGRRPLPEEAPRDHPVDQADRGLSRPGRQAADHGVVPQQQLLRQPELRRRGRRPELLEEGSQGPHAGPVRDPCRHPQVPHRLRPRPERHGGGVHGREGQGQDAPGRPAERPGRPPPQPDPRAHEDALGPDLGHVHGRRLRGRQGRARDPRRPGGRRVARPPLRVAGARGAGTCCAASRSARRSTPAATR